MKIVSAWVEDPTLIGQLAPTKLCVEVDEEPTVTIEPRAFSGGWHVGKYGPFVNYWQQDEGAMLKSPVKAPDFNARFRGRFPAVIDVELVLPNVTIEGFSLPVSRARTLVRKHCSLWRLGVSEKSAEAGDTLWEPMQVHPQCRHWMHDKPRSHPCGGQPAKIIRIGNVDFPMCQHHVEIHNRAQAQKRTAKSA